MDLSVITVTHHSRNYIEELVFSMMMSCFKIEFEHIIVDNASTDGTVEWIESHVSKHVTLIKNKTNEGFAKANNQGVRVAKGRYLLFLNPDMCVKRGELDQLVEWMDGSKDVGLAGCKLLDPMGKEDKTGYPKPFPTAWKMMMWLLRLDSIGIKHPSPLKGELPQQVESMKGAFLLLRKEIADRLGWRFDPRYFILFEDTDLCREVNRLGYKNFFYPGLECIDYLSRSFALKPSAWIYKQFTSSMLKYFRKWHPWYEWIWIAVAIPLGRLLRLKS